MAKKVSKKVAKKVSKRVVKKRNRNTQDKHTTYYKDSIKAVTEYAERHGVSFSLAVDRCLRLCFQLDKEIDQGPLV